MHSKRLRPSTKTYHGAPCGACGATLRYAASKACIACARGRAKAIREHAAGRLDEFIAQNLDALDEASLPEINGTMGRNLAYGMIRQAVLDFQSQDAEDVDSAEHWIRSCSARPFSFDFCCHVLGLDPHIVGKAIIYGRVKDLPELTPEVIEAHEHLVEGPTLHLVKDD